MVVSNSDGMGTVEVKWNNFETNLSYSFKEIRECQDFLDVTLVSDEGEQVRAHKILLSACSPFFHTMLQRNPHENPLVYLKGVNLADLQSILEFIYNGEVNVHQSELNSFLEVAEDLQIKGLTDNINTDDLGGGGVVGGGGGGGVDDDRGVSPPPSQYPPFPLHHPSPLLNNPPPPHAIPTPPPSHLPPHLTPTPTAAVMSPPKKRKTTMTSCSPPPSSMTPPTIVVPSFSSSQQPSLGAVLASNAATTSHPTMPTPAFLTAAVAAENGGSVSDLPPPFKKSRLVGTDDEPKLDSDPDQKDNSTNTADVIVKPETPTPAAAATAGTPPLPALPSLPQHIVDSAPPPSVDASLLADDDEDACGGGDGEKDAFITLDQIKAAAAAGVTIGGAGDKGVESELDILERLDGLLKSYVSEEDGRFCCTLCGRSFKHKSKAKLHLESVHFPTDNAYSCPLCDQKFNTLKGKECHKSKFHRQK
eukprot:TRINITY_DN8055_c0_g1_i3.p1 TRINITY_DN8055_c0_g1~~TRINITY_DN8055_c0_g1_i3.p1  ORF type:complete len:476 (-),score=166.20 TRINITY_DN8055_c0_g1_i3:513-1940(-)